jgi:hypothetical protein
MLPCRRFAFTLTGADARLGADVDRYSFTVVDLHHLLLAGLCRRTKTQDFRAQGEVLTTSASLRPLPRMFTRHIVSI